VQITDVHKGRRMRDGGGCGDAGKARSARFQRLIGVHRPVLERIARRLCREPSVAADLAQDTLEHAWRHFDALQDDARARAWLLRILRNAWLDQLRRRRAEVPIEETCEPSAAAADEPPWWEQVTIEDLRRTIEQLAEPYRTVAVLHDLGGHSYREVAQRLDIPSATAASRLHRAHARIRALLLRELGVDEAA
jgi:RNA polymerase sigma-70 factor, ECF subfamily